jgi:hypothetical protein
MITEPLDGKRGMLDLDKWDRHNGGIARCCAADCGWEGVPTYVAGEAQTWCPKCEGWSSEFGEEPNLRERPLAYDVYLPVVPKRREVIKIGRNEPCPCGSGLKWKRCHGR